MVLANRMVIVLLMIISTSYPPPAYSTQTAEQLAHTKEKLAIRSKQEKQLAAELKANTQILETLRYRATSLAQDLQRSEKALSTSEATIARVSARLRVREAELAREQDRLRQAMVSMIQLSRIPTTALLIQSHTTEETIRAGSALIMLRDTLSRNAEKIKHDVHALHRERTRLFTLKKTAATQQETLLKQRSALLQDIDARTKIQSRLAQQHASRQAEIAALAAQAKNLSDLIASLNTQKTKPPVSGSLRNFGSKGSLAQPVAGNIVHRFGEKKGTNDTYRGMVLRARAGAIVVAPYDGQVVFTGPFLDYGQMVLLRHNNGYISMLAGLSRIKTLLNQSVRAGEPIGLMGNTAQENLYCELRENGKPVDPAGWFATLKSTRR